MSRPLALQTLRPLLSICLLLGGASFAVAQGMPTFSGKKEVHEAVNTKTGAIFDLTGKATMTFPVGLPVGESRLVTLKQGKRPTPSQVGQGFAPVGPTLDFNGAFSTANRPIRVAVHAKKNPAKGGKRLVLAMEIATFCEDHNKKYKLKSGLCSGWEFTEAEFTGTEVVANVESTGGLRMQFGTLPEGGDDE